MKFLKQVFSFALLKNRFAYRLGISRIVIYTSLISTNFKVDGKLAKNSVIFITFIPSLDKIIPHHSIGCILECLTLLEIGHIP